MNNEHRISLLSFVAELCRYHNLSPPTPELILRILSAIADNYFNTAHGCFWLFFNSDVLLSQDCDGAQYMNEYGEPLDDNRIIQFVKEDFTRWAARMNAPGFTEEEQQYLLSALPVPCEYVWPILMWCASPTATGWRSSGNPIYAAALHHGSVVEYKGQLLAADSIEYIGCTGGECSKCQENVNCLYMSEDFPTEEVLCERCGSGQDVCPIAATCLLFSCKHNPENTWPVSAAGRRYYDRSTRRVS